jgi:hypothetical protein
MKTTWQRSELLFCFVIVVVLGAALWASLGWNQRAGLFPWIVLVPTIALALWQLVDDARGKTTPPTVVVGEQGEAAALDTELTSGEMARRGAGVVGWILGFFAAIWLLGWAIGGGVASAAYLRFAAHERWRVSIVYGVIAFLLLDIVFRQMLLIPFTVGTIFEWLNLDPQLRW